MAPFLDEEASIMFEPPTMANYPSLDGWPARIDSCMAWSGPELENENQYTYTLTGAEQLEIHAALVNFYEWGLDGEEVSSSNFVVPKLKNRLYTFAEELHNGRGFFILRGLNPSLYSHEDNLIIFMGIASHIGELRGKQTDCGKMFGHIQNSTRLEARQEERPIKDSNRRCDFHNDSGCDILALQTRSCAEKGGKNLLVSASRIYNELASTRPDILARLADPIWPLDLHRTFAPTDIRPLFFYHDGRVIMNLLPDALFGFDTFERTPGLPHATQEQATIYDLVQKIAHKHALAMTMRPGDLTFVNNFSVMHARDNFEDSSINRRYLLRMWLKNESLAWKLPTQLKLSNDRTFYNEHVKDEWNITPLPRKKFHVYERMMP